MSKINKDSISYDSYDKLAEYYFKDVDNKPYNALYERPALLSMLPNVKDLKVLDAGCASGWYTKWLLDQGAYPIALDFNQKMTEYTTIRVNNECPVYQHDLNNPLDFIEDESLDLIISSLTLHYLKDWDKVMKEFHKKLKKDGLLIFSTHHPFMDFHHFDIENYFEVTLINDVWNTTNGKVEVSFYRRALQDIMKPLINNNFKLLSLEEPFPTKAFQERSPKSYDKLCKNPQFLFIKAVKE